MKKNATLLLILTIFMNTEIDANFDDFYDTISASNAYEEEDFNWHSIESYRPEENEYQRFSDACFYNNKNLFNQIFKKHEFWNNLQRLINPQGPTPLLWATLNDNIEMVQTILLHVDFENNYCNQIALYWAIRLEHVEIVDLLLTKIRPVAAQSGYNPIFNSINDINMIKTDYKNMHSSAFSYRSPNILETAIKTNNYDLVKNYLKLAQRLLK
ncbi:ankyrin repeat domain-containing protein [Candidatus Babeliales bacterium]|nr:ankyrin repeat domain-containing protein [Candidatus Babeliales bacterium]